MRLVLNRVDYEGHVAMFNLGHMKFQLFFKSNWNPLFFSTENAELNQHLMMANMLLSSHGYIKTQPFADKKPLETGKPETTVHDASTTTTSYVPSASPAAPQIPADGDAVKMDTDPPAETSAEEPVKMDVTPSDVPAAPAPPEIGLGRIFDLVMEGYKSQYQFDLEGDDVEDMDEDEEDEEVEAVGDGENGTVAAGRGVNEEPREPTEEEWTSTVLPGVRRFMRREAMAPYLMDEWLRRIEQAKKNVSVANALSMIRGELLSGGPIPKSLRPFIPRRAYGFHSFDGSSATAPNSTLGAGLYGINGEAAKKQVVNNFLAEQWSKMSRRLSNETGFYARPLKGDMLHWTVNMFDFDANSPLGIALMQLALQHHTFDENSRTFTSTSSSASAYSSAKPKPFQTRRNRILSNNTSTITSTTGTITSSTDDNDGNDASSTSSSSNEDVADEDEPMSKYIPMAAAPKKVEATNITIEVLFPESFDEEDAVPFFRIIRPTLLDLPEDFFENVFKTFKPKPNKVAGATTTPPTDPLTAAAEPTHLNASSNSSEASAQAIRPSYYAALATSSGGVSSSSLGDSSSDVSSSTANTASSVSTSDAAASPTSTVAGPTATITAQVKMDVGEPSEPSSSSSSSWANKTFDLFDFFADLRLCLLTQNPRVDMNSALTGYQTTGFWKKFRCISAVMADEEKIEGTGKVCLPSSCLELIYGGGNRVSVSLSMSGNISPMTFELCGIDSKVSTYCGVLEFTAQEGTVVVPSWMFQMLHFQEGEMVMLRQITLPPGDFVKLQPLTDSYQVEGINPKALLEWRLRDFVALTKGEILPILSHGHTFKFSVLDVRPGHAIAITDRDITVEFVDPLETTTNEHSSAPPSHPSSATGALLGPVAGSILSSPSHSSSSKGETPVKSPLKTGHADGGAVVGGKRCDTCRHMIPEAAFLTHSMRCPRMNYYCELCQMAVPKAEKEAHDASMHALTECGRCHEKMEVRLLANHAQNSCKARIVKCAYCELNMPAESKETHETQCGSRTVKCTDCGVRVSVRFLEEHKSSGCVKKEEPRRFASPTNNNRRSSGSFMSGTDSSPYSTTSSTNSQMFICETCKAPIDSFDELQVHMLTVHYTDDSNSGNSNINIDNSNNNNNNNNNSSMDTSGTNEPTSKPQEE